MAAYKILYGLFEKIAPRAWQTNNGQSDEMRKIRKLNIQVAANKYPYKESGMVQRFLMAQQ